MKNFIIRTLSGAVYVILVVGAIYAGRITNNETTGNVALCILLAAVCMTGTGEIVSMFGKRGDRINKPMAFATAALTYAIIVWAALSTDGTWLYTLPALWLCTLIVQLWSHDDTPFVTTGHTLLPTIWTAVPLSMMVLLHHKECGLLMLVFVLIWVNDSFAYMTGMLIGKHKMWERHSPKKTWEGTLGGALFCLIAAATVGPMLVKGDTSTADFIVMGAICSTTGTLGDLVESMFKRYCQLKDSGKIMPGHGGIMDRFDSMLTSVPFIMAYLGIRAMI